MNHAHKKPRLAALARFAWCAACLALAAAGEPARSDAPAPDVAAVLADRAAKAETLYNLGVQRYRAGDLESARALFEAAAARGKAEVAARSMYNKGTTRYAESLPKTPQGAAAPNAAAPGDPGALSQSIETLEQALRDLKDAVRADPANADARANAELAHRVLKQLKQQQQQQQDQQKQDQQKQDQQKQDQQKQDQQKQDQQKQDQQKQDQQKQDQQKQDQQKQDQQKQDQQKQDQQKQDQQKQDQQKQDQQKQDQQKQDQQKQEAAANPKDKKPMNKQDVERLLQKIRDREKLRLAERFARERGRTQPAARDW